MDHCDLFALYEVYEQLPIAKKWDRGPVNL